MARPMPESFQRQWLPRDFCARGHALTPDNRESETRTVNGKTYRVDRCKVCSQARKRAWARRKAQEGNQ